MMKRLIAAVLLAAAAATPASALLHPKYYEAARANAPDVVVVKVLRVRPPPRPLGACRVEAEVLAVERGAARKVGEALSFDVMCYRRPSDVPSSGVIYTERKALMRAEEARAFLAADGSIALYQFDILR